MKRIIVGISGASGIIYGIRTLQFLHEVEDVETHAVITPSAYRTAQEETDFSAEEIRSYCDHVYNHRDTGAAIASGSFRCDGMLVIPCSVKSLSGIANCYANELIERAADVCLKERRRLVLLFRETPLHAGHIELMARATQSGAIIMPPAPGFYTKPESIDDIVAQTVGRALDLVDIHLPHVRRWTGKGVQT